MFSCHFIDSINIDSFYTESGENNYRIVKKHRRQVFFYIEKDDKSPWRPKAFFESVWIRLV